MNENEKVLDNQLETDTANDYIETINQLKANSVSKEEFLKLKAENKQLLNAIATNQNIEVAAEPKRDIAELRKEIFQNHSKLSNRELVSDIMELYDRELENGVNIFMPTDPNYIPTTDDVTQIDNMVAGMKSALEIAGNSDLIFNQEMERILK